MSRKRESAGDRSDIQAGSLMLSVWIWWDPGETTQGASRSPARRTSTAMLSCGKEVFVVVVLCQLLEAADAFGLRPPSLLPTSIRASRTCDRHRARFVPRACEATSAPWRSISSCKGLVLGPGRQDRFDSPRFANPVVQRYKDEDGENWRMWYHGRDLNFGNDVFSQPTGRIGLAESPDGVHWERVDGDEDLGAVLTPNKEEWWGFDTSHVGVGDVQGIKTDKIRGSGDRQGTVQFMYFFGGDQEEVDVGGIEMGGQKIPEGVAVKGLRMRIGLCLSFDGVHWTRLEGDHHSGAVFDVGQKGEWDHLFNAWPTVVQHSDNDFRMYYSSFDPQTSKYSIGLARSTDGIKWKKEGMVINGGGGDAFDARGCGRRHVVEDPETAGYLMFVEGVDMDGRHSIGLYKSSDGLKWERSSDKPVLQGSQEEGAWDAENVGCPWVVPMEDGSCRLYYSSSSRESGSHGIGMALSDGKDWTRFTRFDPIASA